jgi:hypothetical protein
MRNDQQHDGYLRQLAPDTQNEGTMNNLCALFWWNSICPAQKPTKTAQTCLGKVRIWTTLALLALTNPEVHAEVKFL